MLRTAPSLCYFTFTGLNRASRIDELFECYDDLRNLMNTVSEFGRQKLILSCNFPLRYPLVQRNRRCPQGGHWFNAGHYVFNALTTILSERAERLREFIEQLMRRGIK